MKTTLADAIQRIENQPILACQVGTDASARLAAFATKRLGHSCLLVADANTFAVAGEKVTSALDAVGKHIIHKIYGPNPLDATEELGDEIAAAGQDADFFVAIGSGTLCDLVKHAGTKLDKPSVLYATAASMNSYTSGITALKVRGLKRTTPCAPAIAVFADPEVVATAPQRMAAAGVADFLSKCSSASDWRAAHLLRNEYYSPKAMEFYEGTVEQVLDAASGVGKAEPEALAVLLEALLLSGLSMLAAGSSSPASGGEHLLSHYLDMKSALYGTRHDLHGAQVGVGTVHCLSLWESILSLDAAGLDADALVQAQPTDAEIRAWIEEDWGPAVAGEVLAQWQKKALPPDKLRDEITWFKAEFQTLRE
ncbi:MAG: iron-containing alcohol dehydrogenase, partial [Candidatus Hydrogenedentes bacterium]|nr:iron-containing alcohol dehydrogenase [Candidatus Hydrogenedentota bacterium]